MLVTGGFGYLGSVLARALAGVSARLVLLGLAPTGDLGTLPGHVERVTGDVSTHATWERVLPGVDYVFHLAAFEHRHGSEHNPGRDLAVNAGAVLALTETCRRIGASPRIVFASSSNIHGVVSRLPVDENAPDRPLTLFGVHKLMSEKYLQLYAAESGLRSVSLRLANLYGPSERAELHDRSTLNRILRRALAGGPLSVFGNRDRVRDYLYVEDAAEAFLAAGRAAETAGGTPFLVGSGVATTIDAAVHLIAERAGARIGRGVEVRVDESAPIAPTELRDFVADSGRFAEATDWHPRVLLREGIDRTIDALTETTT